MMKRLDARRFDGLLLALLVVTMCGQIDPVTMGRDMFVISGYVEKQLKVALCDLVLFGTFVWFVVRTTMLRAWNRLWWPPLPCWALLAALLVSVAHSPRVIESVVTFVHPTPGLSADARHRLLQAPREAIAEVVQFAGYFLVAPWLFVNLLRDRRDRKTDEVAIERRSLALWAFAGGVALNLAVGIVQLAGTVGRGTALDSTTAPRGLWSSPNLYGSFFAIALPLLWARAVSGEAIRLQYARARTRGLVMTLALAAGALLTMATPFAAVAQGFGMAMAALLRASARGLALTALLLVFAAWSWRGIEPMYAARAPYLQWKEHAAPPHGEGASSSGPQRYEVQKRWIEWEAAQGWSAPRDATVATGVGPGNYQLNIGKYYVTLPNIKKMPPDSNNFYLVQGVSLGLTGLAALLWILGHFAGEARRAAEINRADWLGAGTFAFLAAWLVVNVFHALLVRGLGLVLAFGLALAIVARMSAGAARSEERIETPVVP